MQDQKLTAGTSQLTFKDYYQSIENKSPRTQLRAKICARLGIADSSLFDKIRNNRFTILEKEAIAELCQEPVSILFPEDAQ